MTSSMTPPRDRPTDPAAPMSDHDLLVSLMEHVSGIAASQRRTEANTDLIITALKDHGVRISRVEEQQFNGSGPPAGLETE